MPPRGWSKNPVAVPRDCPNCGPDKQFHSGGQCFNCTCNGWMVLGARNEYKVPAGWYKWGTKGPITA